MEQILPTDNVHEMARKMFYEYTVGQSCVITGLVEAPDGEIKPKGEAVCDELRRLDKAENYINAKGARGGQMKRRKRERHDNQIGDYLKQKAFRFSSRDDGAQVKISIWRIQ